MYGSMIERMEEKPNRESPFFSKKKKKKKRKNVTAHAAFAVGYFEARRLF